MDQIITAAKMRLLMDYRNTGASGALCANSALPQLQQRTIGDRIEQANAIAGSAAASLAGIEERLGAQRPAMGAGANVIDKDPRVPSLAEMLDTLIARLQQIDGAASRISAGL